MLDRDAGLERQIGLAHGAAGAPAAQEIADGIGGERRMLARVHAPIMRRERAGVNRDHVGWGEESEPHQSRFLTLMGFTALYPSYGLRESCRDLPHPLGGKVIGGKKGLQR